MKGPSKGRFEEIFSTGKRVTCPLLKVSSLPGRGHVGIATAKKIGHHPARNLVKRRVSEAIRTMAPALDQRFDYVVIAGKAASEASFKRIQSELREALDSAVRRWENDSQFF